MDKKILLLVMVLFLIMPLGIMQAQESNTTIAQLTIGGDISLYEPIKANFYYDGQNVSIYATCEKLDYCLLDKSVCRIENFPNNLTLKVNKNKIDIQPLTSEVNNNQYVIEILVDKSLLISGWNQIEFNSYDDGKLYCTLLIQ